MNQVITANVEQNKIAVEQNNKKQSNELHLFRLNQ